MSALPSSPDKFGFRTELLEPLRWAMNPENLRQPLATQWPELTPSLDALELERVHPRGDRGFLLEYRIGDQVLYAELVGAEAQRYSDEVWRKLNRLTVSQTDDPAPLCLLLEPGLVVRRPGIDHRLPLLGVLNRPDQAEPLLAPALGDGVRILSGSLLAHRLGRRAVLRLRYLTAENRQPRELILKCYKERDRRVELVFNRMRQLESGVFGYEQRLRGVRPYHCLGQHSALLMENVAGTPLDQLRGTPLIAGVRDAGEILRRLQGAKVPVEKHHRVDDELAILARWVPLAAAVFPSLSDRLLRTWNEVEKGLSRLGAEEPVICHRDYYDKQLIVGEQATVLLDLDTLCRADPALDIGNFLAHLQLLELQQRGAAAPLWRAFHAGYGDRQKARPQAITWYRRAALLRVACLHAFWTRWHPLAGPLLDACDVV